MKNWKLKSAVPNVVKEKIIGVLSLHLLRSLTAKGEGNTDLLTQLLYNRGLTEQKQIEEFLNPEYEKLHSPFLFMDMQKAVHRIWEAIDNHQKICIYGDYDADAVTANAVLLQTFKYLGVEASFYIPDRFTEGYGVNLEALEKIRNDGAKIIITVDCGTNSIDAAEFCHKNNIDLIITDHHEIIGEVPKAFAVINPKNPNDKYPYSEITGVGVAFKLASGILSANEKVTALMSSRNFLSPDSNQSKNIRDLQQRKKMDPDSEAGMAPKGYVGGWEKWLLDLVAIGTVADCHSLMGENRLLVKYGLRVLAKTKWVGLKALIASAGLDFNQKQPDTHTLGFVIAPRLNAAGRLEHAGIALSLLMEQDQVSAQQKAAALEQINSRRQDLTQRTLSEAREQALQYQDRKILVLLGEDWPKGVVGLVAGRIAEEFNKPAIVLNKEKNESTGSARTVGEFNLIEALKFSAQHLVKFGGHKQAAGLTLKTSEFEQFYRKILDYAEKNLPDENQTSILELESELSTSDLSLVTCNLLLLFEPFGVDNHKPKFLINNLKIQSMRFVGASQQHLQMTLALFPMSSRNFLPPEFNQPAKNIRDPEHATVREEKSDIIQAIYFNANDFAKNLKVGDTIDAAAELIKDGWNGREQVKLRIIDIQRN